MKTSMQRLNFALALSIAGSFLLGAANVQADGWPQWRGPHRDGKSADTGLLQTWPPDGPSLAWKTTGLGNGYFIMSSVGYVIYTMGDKGGVGRLLALRASDGAIIWSAEVGAAGAPVLPKYHYPGPRCTPAVSDGLVFALDAWGELVCVDAADGKEQWRKNFSNDFGGKPPTWGFSESPLVDGDRVIVTPGGKKGAVVALDKKTGRLLWQTEEFTDEAHYSSIIPAEIEGTRQYIQLTGENVVGISPDDGDLLWKTPRPGRVAVIPTPIVSANQIYVTSGYNIGSNLFRVTASDGRFSAEQVYADPDMVNHHGGVIKIGDYLYGYSDKKGFACQNFQTGEIIWAERKKIKKGCVSYADDRLYFREERSGTMILLAPSPDGYREKGRFLQPDRAEENAWAHPTIANGKLYLRDQDLLLCYTIDQ